MMRNQRRQEIWAYGRALRDQLLSRYRDEYGEDIPRPPAMIVDELLTDFLGATLCFDPLALQVYAQTEWKDGRPLVTVNSLTEQIPGVKDAAGVQNVAKFHEVVHVDRDLPELKSNPQLSFPDVGPPTSIVCHWALGYNNMMTGGRCRSTSLIPLVGNSGPKRRVGPRRYPMTRCPAPKPFEL